MAIKGGDFLYKDLHILHFQASICGVETTNPPIHAIEYLKILVLDAKTNKSDLFQLQKFMSKQADR